METKNKLGDVVFTNKELKDALKANADGGKELYIGINDDSIDFGKAESFIDESEGEKEFNLSIVNNTDSVQKIQFNEIIAAQDGYDLLKQGVIKTVGEGDDAKELTAEGDPRSIDVLTALISKAPMRLRAVRFNVNNEGQLDELMKYVRETPFETGVTSQKKPSNFQDQNTNNTKTVTVDLKDWILGHDSTILYSIRAHETVNLTLYFGASYDLAKALRKKHARAIKAAATYYAQNA